MFQCNKCGNDLTKQIVTCRTFSTGLLSHTPDLEFHFCTNRECGYFELPWLRSELRFISLKKRFLAIYTLCIQAADWLANENIHIPAEAFHEETC